MCKEIKCILSGTTKNYQIPIFYWSCSYLLTDESYSNLQFFVLAKLPPTIFLLLHISHPIIRINDKLCFLNANIKVSLETILDCRLLYSSMTIYPIYYKLKYFSISYLNIGYLSDYLLRNILL